MELDTLNLTQICRTCKCVAPQMRSLFEEYENVHQSPRIDEMLRVCASIQVQCGDGLPAQICQICVKQLRNAFIFKRQVETIDVSLREYVKNLTVNEIKEEPPNSDFVESQNTLSQEPPKSPVVPKIETDHIQFLDNDQILLTCRECSKGFGTVKGLQWHKRVHTGNIYKCSKCDKQYTRLDHLQRHEESHSRKKAYVCKICSKTLVTMKHLRRHLVTHLKEKPFSCNTCNRVFSRAEHLHSHTPKCKGDMVYPCDTCNKAFTREDNLEVHKKMHDNQPNLVTIENLDKIQEYYYQVDQDLDAASSDNSDVDNCFEPQIEMTESMDGNGVKEMVDISLNDESNISETSIAGGNDNNNDHDSSVEKVTELVEKKVDESIDVKVEDSLEMKDNVLEAEDEILTVGHDFGESSGDSTDPEYVPNKSVSPKNKRGRSRPHKNPLKPTKTKVLSRGRDRSKINKGDKEEYGEFPCPACQEMFNTMIALDRHARIKHKGLKVYKCKVCNKDFSRAYHLKRHAASHSVVKPYRCHVCTKSFSRRDHLNQHQEMHKRGNDFECDICQKAFNRADSLTNHKALKHGTGEKVVGEKKYECPFCHKGFTTEKYRDIHVSGHNGQKDYQCAVCEKTFLTKSHLAEHMKMHNVHAKKFLCTECGQRFIRNDSLVIHMRRHRGEKPFKCKYCGKGFPRRTDLTVHETYHTGEKTHMCSICGKGFGRAYNLTVHMRTHTGEKPYQCTYCDSAFAQCNDLKAHVRRHTGERYHCEFCSESFVMGYLLNQHKRAVHGINVLSNTRRLNPIHKLEKPEKASSNHHTAA